MTTKLAWRVEDALRLYLTLDQRADLYCRLLQEYESPAQALACTSAQWQLDMPRLGARYLEQHEHWLHASGRHCRQQWQTALAWLAEPGRGLWLHQPARLESAQAPWPTALNLIEAPPPLLFWQGCDTVLGLPQIAIVGSRAATPQGLQLAHQIAADLCRAGFAVTSGLASGIDGAAHKGALAAGGRTVAVMGRGLEQIYPPQHRVLAGQIVRQDGLLVSEFAPRSPALAHNFPRRNRVISALSLGTLLVEAGPSSGSLLTAQACDQLSRPVWALPGSVCSLQSRGCHELIRRGQAQLVESAEQIIADIRPLLQSWYGLAAAPLSPPAPAATIAASAHRPPLSPTAETLLQQMGWDIQGVDALVSVTQWPARQTMATLAELELGGWIASVPGGYQRLPS